MKQRLPFSQWAWNQRQGWLKLLALALPLASQAQAPTVTVRNPVRNAMSAARSTPVSLTFSQPLNPTTAGNVRVFSSQRGGQLVRGGNATASGNTLTVTPAQNLKAGETVLVTVPATVTSAGGTGATPHSYQFTAATAPAAGTFGTATTSSAGNFPIQAVSGDLNGDGYADLAVTNYSNSPGTLGVYLGSSAGTLGSQMLFTLSSSPYGVALGDLNNDGRLDVVVGCSNGTSVLLNTGTPALFGSASTVAAGTESWGVALGDVNNDGQLDLLTTQAANGTGTTVRTLLGTGNGTFGVATAYPTGVGPFSATLADFNNDGYLDILTPDYNNTGGSATTTSVSVLLNNGNGTFRSRIGYVVGVDRLRRAVAADFNNDGNLDIAAFGEWNSKVYVLLGTGTGSFGAATAFPTSGGRDMAVGDVNGDGNQDVIISNALLLGNGQGSFASSSIAASNAFGLALADFNNDDRLDLTTSDGGSNTVSLLLGQAATPALTSISPARGPVGTSVTLTGSNLTGATAVTFAGPSNNTVTTGLLVSGSGSSQTVTVNVPPGATTGNVTITTPSGTTNGLAFTVIQPTTVTSIAPAGTNPTNATSVSYTLTFAASVTGVTAANFSLTADPGITGASITAVSGTGTTYTIVVNTGSGSGSLGLNLANDTGLSSKISNSPFTSGTAYTIDKTPPTVTITSSTAASGGTSGSASFSYTATFSETTTNFTAAAVTVTNGTLSGFTGNGLAYTFAVTPTATGVVAVSVAAGVASDAAGNGNVASNTYGIAYVVPPTVTTALPYNIAATSAMLGGEVTADGGMAVTARGVVYSSTNPNPTVGGTGVSNAVIDSGSGTYAQLVSNLEAGTTYYAVAYATNSVGTSYGTVRSFTTALPLAIEGLQINVSCNGGSDGTATITTTGGVPGYTYTWSPNVSNTSTANTTSNTATGLSSNVYNVIVTDASGATISRNFVITQPARLIATGSQTNLACNGSNTGAASVTPSGGTPGYSYSWSPNVSTTNSATDLGAGTYTVTVTDANGCTATSTYTITQPDVLTTAGAQTNISTTGGTDGAATVTVSGGTPSYTYSWSPNVSTTESATGLVAGTYTVTVTDANGCTATHTFTITQPAPITATTWLGSESTDWYTAGNWSAGVPTSALDAVIATSALGNYPRISTDTATTKGLTINAGTSLTMDDGTLDVRSDLTNNGAFTATGGTVLLGTTAITNGPNILGSTRLRFWNLTVNNSVLLSTSAGAAVQRLLTLNGAFVTQGNPFVLESDASGTALVVNNGSAGLVIGSATVQRSLDASGNTSTSGYHHYSSPVDGATVSSLSTSTYGGNFTAQVNPAYNTTDPTQLTPAAYPNVFSYDESKIAGSPAVSLADFDKGYQSPQALSDPLAVGQGYAVFIGNTEKVQLTGLLHNNDQTIGGLTHAATDPASAASAGWALIGNPYPAPLDWGTVGTAPGSSLSGVDGAAYVLQRTSTAGGRYTSFTNNVGAGTGVIASGQGFFVHASTPGATGSVTLTNANRVTSYASPSYQHPAETRPLLRLSLGLGSQPTTTATAQDETFIYFEAGATDAFDGRYDAYKLANPSGYYLGSVTPGSAPLGLSIDGRAPLIAATTEIPLQVSLPVGAYSLTATELLNFATMAGGTTVQLRDALLGTLTDLAATPSYSFAVAANAPSAGRFSLIFRTSNALAALPSASLGQAEASLYPNPATSATALRVTGLSPAVAGLRIEVLDVVGRAVAHYDLPVRAGSAHQSLATDQLAGTLYLVRLTALDAQGQVQSALPTQRLMLNR